MIKTSFYENYTLNKNSLFAFLLSIIVIFFLYFYIQTQIKNFSYFYQSFTLQISFLFNLFTIKIISSKIKYRMQNIIFSNINIYLNEKNRTINFSQKDEIKKEDKSGFNFYITLVSNNNIKDRKKIKKNLNKKIIKIFNRFLSDSTFDNIMAKEHWYRIAYATFLYFILFILLLEMINIGKEIFDFENSEIFHILILITIFIDFMLKQLKNIFTKILSIFLLIIFFSLMYMTQDYKIILNSTYSISLLIISLFILLYITSILIKVIKASGKDKSIEKDELDIIFLIDMYFNKKFLSIENNKKPKKEGMQKELFYALIGFLFTISVPIIIDEVKTPSVHIEYTKGKNIEQTK